MVDVVTHLQAQAKSVDDAMKIQKSIYGIEWKQLPYMLWRYKYVSAGHRCIRQIVHGDGLAKNVLDLNDSDLFDCVIMNPDWSESSTRQI